VVFVDAAGLPVLFSLSKLVKECLMQCVGMCAELCYAVQSSMEYYIQRCNAVQPGTISTWHVNHTIEVLKVTGIYRRKLKFGFLRWLCIWALTQCC